MTLHPISGDPRRCELVITTDLRPGMNKNAKVGFGIGAAMGGGGAAVGIALAAAKGAALLAAPVGIGALAVVGAGMLGVYRWGYRWGLNKARKELEGLIDQVQSSARSQDVFGSVPPPPPPPEATGDGGVGVLLSGL